MNNLAVKKVHLENTLLINKIDGHSLKIYEKGLQILLRS